VQQSWRVRAGCSSWSHKLEHLRAVVTNLEAGVNIFAFDRSIGAKLACIEGMELDEPRLKFAWCLAYGR